MEVGKDRDYKYNLNTYGYTVSTRMTQDCIKMGSDESHFNVLNF